MHKKRTMSQSLRSCLIVGEYWWKLSEKCQNRWWNLGVRLWCWNKSAFVTVDGKIVTMTKKSTSESLKCEGDVDFFFFKLEGYRSLWVCSTWWDIQLRVLPKRPEAFEGGSVKEEAWGVDKQRLDAAPWQCTSSRVTTYPWIFDEAWNDCCSPATLLSRFGPCRLFPVPTVEILTERSPISDDRRGRRKLDTGPSRHPAKQVPGRVPEVEKTLGAVYQEWRGVLWRRQVWVSCE